jgi:signal transduction histidine kinase
LINDILDLARVESGKMQVEWDRVDLGTLVADTVRQIETQAREGVVVSIVAPTLDPIHSDAGRLRQILINLVGNALKFTDAGRVTVTVDVEPGTNVASRIRITDTGPGIPPDRLHAIFEAFEQADRSTETRYGGTGLGLSISRALCALLGYTLSVKSEPGHGSEFTIDLLAEQKRRLTGAGLLQPIADAR